MRRAVEWAVIILALLVTSCGGSTALRVNRPVLYRGAPGAATSDLHLVPDAAAAAEQQQGGSCPEGFEAGGGALRGTCYRFVTEYEPWVGALRACAQLHAGASLVSIESATEQHAIISYIYGNAERLFGARSARYRVTDAKFWTSGFDGPGRNQWTWFTSLQPIDGFISWARDEPSHYKFRDRTQEERCVQINGRFNYNWTDAQCKRNAYYICELTLLS